MLSVLSHKSNIKYSPRYFVKQSSEGFTLIETLISIAVFTIGIMAALGLSVSNYNDSQDNLDRIMATNLARESIELVKNVRDSNWLKIDANEAGVTSWDYGLTGSSDYVAISYTSTTPNFLPSCVGSIVSCVQSYTDAKLYINATKFYTHGPTVIPTKYSRAIKLAKICLESDGEIPPGTDPINFEYVRTMSELCNQSAGDTHIGFKLIAHVQWEDEGTKYIEITDTIYNWRR